MPGSQKRALQHAVESTKQKMHGPLACEPLVVHESTDAVHLDIPSKDDIVGGAAHSKYCTPAPRPVHSS